MRRLLIITLLLMLPLTVAADSGEERERTNPSAEAMIFDAALTRPLGLIGTALGTGLFIATLPVSIVGGNVGDAAESFVKEPARYTFSRCLGCDVDNR